jgi:hypothetical protein
VPATRLLPATRHAQSPRAQPRRYSVLSICGSACTTRCGIAVLPTNHGLQPLPVLPEQRFIHDPCYDRCCDPVIHPATDDARPHHYQCITSGCSSQHAYIYSWPNAPLHKHNPPRTAVGVCNRGTTPTPASHLVRTATRAMANHACIHCIVSVHSQHPRCPTCPSHPWPACCAGPMQREFVTVQHSTTPVQCAVLALHACALTTGEQHSHNSSTAAASCSSKC